MVGAGPAPRSLAAQRLAPLDMDGWSFAEAANAIAPSLT
jgi:hypothetical protein